MGGQTTRRRFPARVGRIRSPDRNVTHELFNRRLPVTRNLPFLLRSYARAYVTLLRVLLLPCPPCISFSQSTLSAVKLPLCVFYHLPLLDDDSSKPFYRVLG